MIAFVSFILGYALASLMSVSGRADDRIAIRASLCALRYELNDAIVNARFGLAQYPDAPPDAWVVDVPMTAGMCRALLGAFGMV